MIRFFVLVAMGLVLFAGPGRAEPAPGADSAEFRRIIASQIEAFRVDDGAGAYAFAAPGIRRLFPTPDVFMSMVRGGYRPVYRPRSFAFGEVETDPAGRPVQHVGIIDAEGRNWTAYYAFERQPDGRWLIAACVLRRVEGADV